jgi:hypothetical protein
MLDPQWNSVCPSLVLKIWVGYGPAGNHTKTGTFTEREGINNIEGCIESCCEEESCNVVFMYKLTCFQVRCDYYYYTASRFRSINPSNTLIQYIHTYSNYYRLLL